MKKLVTITKKSFMFYLSMIAIIGLLWACSDDDDDDLVILPPTITEISPTTSFVGVEVTIFGTNFRTSTADNAVSFNGTAATVSAATASSLTTTVPEGATTGDVTVTTNDLTSAGFLFTVAIPIIPTITSIDPTSGEIGDIVTITGTDFSTTPEDNIVSFNGGIATVMASTETIITTTVPATASTGDVTVTRDRESNGILFTVTTPIFSVTRHISTEADDAEEGENGRMANESSDLEFGEYDTWEQDGIAQGLQTIGIKFDTINIPASAVILNATIQFTADNIGADPVQLTIYGEMVGNPKSYTDKDVPLPDGTVDILFDITSRPKTTASAVWDIPEWVSEGDAGEAQKTVDLSSIIQEIIAGPDWVSGNSIAFIMEHSGPSIGVTSSTGGREAEAGPEDDSAEITIIYQ